MSVSLVMYDVDLFLNKYTRFMTKDVYISKNMYDNFLKSYNYLYNKLENDAILFRENSKYKKMFEIREKKEQILKLHNQKYLKKNLDNYLDFFNNIKLDVRLDNTQRSIILSNEDRMLVINNKNVESLIVGKVKYLIDILRVKKNKILVLVDDDSKINMMFKENDLEKVDLINVKCYENDLFKEKTLVTNNDKYNILLDYIMNILFKDKEKFNILYKAFSSNIYLNKDYHKYNLFSDYHNYMYKRMFLSSKLSLDRFVDKEIDKRKKYLRTIKNELVQKKEEVDVSNYLCFNNVSYKYLDKEQLFLICDKKNNFKLKVVSQDDRDRDNYDGNIIYINVGLIKDNSYKEILDDELRLRGIKKKELKCEEIYNVLKDSMIDNYFSEFIDKYLIKYLDYYDVNKDFYNTKFSDVQIKVLKEIYEYYKKCLDRDNFITKRDISLLLEKRINSKNYKYIIINSDISLGFNGNLLKIISDYKDVELIKENIKLLYDYKRYLHDNKVLVAANTFVDELEIDRLTSSFLEKNLSVINDYFMNSDKKVSIYLYDDSNRLFINKNIAMGCYEVIRKNKDILIGVNSINNINSLVYKDYLVKIGKNRLVVNDKKVVNCEEVLKIRKSYDKIILPFLIIDSYHEDLTVSDDDYFIKFMIYISLSKCKSELILLCPCSKKNRIMKLFKKVKNIFVFE